MVSSILQKVKEFSEACDVPVAAMPHFPQSELRELRISLLKEEWEEYLEAEQQNDLVEVADALADILYIVAGTCLVYGLPMEQIFQEVHASNMSKLDPETGRPLRRADGKILKSETYRPPDIKQILKNV